MHRKIQYRINDSTHFLGINYFRLTWAVKGSQSKYFEYMTKPTNPQRYIIPQTATRLLHMDLVWKNVGTKICKFLITFFFSRFVHFCTAECFHHKKSLNSGLVYCIPTHPVEEASNDKRPYLQDPSNKSSFHN